MEEIQIFYSVIWRCVIYTLSMQVHCLEVMQKFLCRWELYLYSVGMRCIYVYINLPCKTNSRLSVLDVNTVQFFCMACIN